MFDQLVQLEQNGARIRVVEEQQVVDGGYVWQQIISRPVSDRAVANFENGLEHTRVFRINRAQCSPEEAADVKSPLYPTAHVEEPPTLRARHVFPGQTLESGEANHEFTFVVKKK